MAFSFLQEFMQRLIFPILSLLAALTTFGLSIGSGASAVASLPPNPAPETLHLPLVVRSGPLLTFVHGVASGDVTTSGATLWTRGNSEAVLTLEVATDPTFAQVAYTSTVSLTASSDFTAKTNVTGLSPDRDYFYRWRSGRHVSATGTFKSAPLPSESAGVRFAFTGDTDGTMVGGQPGFNRFQALDALRADQPDFFVYLGDTVYTDSYLRPNGPAQTLTDYRASYQLNRTYPALTSLLAATSTYAIWDDHEVLNDFAGQTISPARYGIGRQAFMEYMPLDGSDLPADSSCAGPPLFRLFHWGRDVDVIILDERSCRSADVAHLCLDQNGVEDSAPTLPSAGRLLLGIPPVPPLGCREAIADPNRTMLGAVQKAAFKDALQHSTARFKFVINEVPMQQYYLGPYDRWEGYGAERAEILNFIRDHEVSNVIFLSGDAHMNLMNDVYIDKFTDPEPIAYEAISGPVAALTLEAAIIRFIGPWAVTQLQAGLDLIGVDCRHLDAYSYGLVEVQDGAAVITLKDAAGSIISDQHTPGLQCVHSFGP